MAAVARGVKELFPGRSFCIRIVDARTGGADVALRGGPAEGGRARAAGAQAERGGEDAPDAAARCPAARGAASREVPLLFHGSAPGVSAPLVASGQLFGVINMEYPRARSAGRGARRAGAAPAGQPGGGGGAERQAHRRADVRAQVPGGAAGEGQRAHPGGQPGPAGGGLQPGAERAHRLQQGGGAGQGPAPLVRPRAARLRLAVLAAPRCAASR